MVEKSPDGGAVENSDAALFDQLARLPRWFSEEALRPVSDINRRLLVLMAGDPAQLQVPPSLMHALRMLDAAALERIARCPCLLVDAGFKDERRWKGARAALIRTSAKGGGRSSSSRSRISLARLTWFLSWHYARSYPEPARLIIGIGSASAQALRELTLEELDRLAETHSEWIQPRWLDRPAVWEKLAAATKEVEQPFTADLRGLQIMLGDLLDEPP